MPPVDLGLAVFDPTTGLVHADPCFAQLVLPPAPATPLAPWLAQWGVAFPAERGSLRTMVTGGDGQPVELTLVRLPDQRVAVTVAPGLRQPQPPESLLDASGRRLVEAECHKLFLAVEHSPASVVITDAAGVIEYVNPRFCEITGYDAGEVLGQTPRLCRSGATPPEVYAELWRTIRTGRIWEGELLNRRKDGSLYWESLRIAPIVGTDGVITHFVAVKADVTVANTAAQAMREAKEQAEEAARAKSEFLAMMSHEIRTPMNGILGMVRLLRDTPLNDEQRDYCETVRVSGEALLTILNDILDFSKLEAGQLSLEVVDFGLRGLVDGVLNLMRGRAEEKGLRIEVVLDAAVPDRVSGDPARLRQVLLNLLSNAVKFTDAGWVRLAVHPVGATDAVDVRLRFVVADSGIGIAEEARPKLFSEFVQADSSIARRFGGTGLGLAICKRILGLMGGEIGVDSTPGQGSSFWFEVTLPRATMGQAAASAAAGEGHGPPGGALRPLNVLLAEDNPVNQKVATALLAKAGHVVTVAKDGAAAVAAAAAGTFDLVLMDVQMPGLDGFEATRRIRALGDKGRLPILAMTANVLRGDEQRCLEAGMDDYLAKPIQPQTLYAALSRWCDEMGAGNLELDRLRELEDQLGVTTLTDLLKDYAAMVPLYVRTLRDAADRGDVAALQHGAHDLKALSGTFGLGTVTALAAAVEGAARERGEGGPRLVAALERAVEVGLVRLKRRYP